MYTCAEYRREMLLIALQRRLNHQELTEVERREIQEKIRQLEAEMGMD